MSRGTRISAALVTALCFAVVACGKAGDQPAAPAAPAPASSAAGLSGAERTEFVNGAAGSCTAKGLEDPRIARLPRDSLDGYCKCYANALADRMTRGDVAAIDANPSQAAAVMGSRIQNAIKACQWWVQ